MASLAVEIVFKSFEQAADLRGLFFDGGDFTFKPLRFALLEFEQGQTGLDAFRIRPSSCL